MSIAHYIIFHPERARQAVKVSAKILSKNIVTSTWEGTIWVDKVRVGNEDPFVFTEKWLYSYCHASQLRRNVSHCYLQKGSYLIFCSGDSANNSVLKIDTVFEIENVHFWQRSPILELPQQFISHMYNGKSELWRRHFKYPFYCVHQNVTHTYEANVGNGNSFLPLTKDERTEVKFEELSLQLRDKIQKKVWGKYPVLLDEDEKSSILNFIKSKADILVIGEITEKG